MYFKDRNSFILPFIKNKEILDLGFLGETSEKYSFLHQFLLKHAKKRFRC